MDFTFDKNGNPLTIAYPGGVVASYTYDFADREAALSVDAGGGGRSVVTASAYRAHGPLASLTFGTTPGRTETRGHDAGYLPLSIAVSNGLLAWSYTLDEVGNVTAIAQTQPTSGSRGFGYQDYQYYLTCAAGPWAAGSACGPASGGALAWSYDKIGNRLGETRSGWTDAYAYHLNPAGGNSPRLEAVALGVGGWRAYAFGAAGHLEAVDAGANAVLFEPDPAGQLGGVSRTEDRVASFRYDGRGFLAAAVASSPGSRGPASGRAPGSALFADGFESGDVCAWSRAHGWSGPACGPPPVESSLVPLYDSGGRLHALFPAGETAQGRYVFYFAGRAVAILRREAEPVWTFLTTDHLGTPVHAMDGTGTTTWLGGFEPFGRDWQVGAASASANGVFLRLPGQWVDPLWEDATLGTEVF